MQTKSFKSKFLQNNLANTLVVIACLALGYFFSTPSGASPDEQVHSATAWYTFENGLPPTITKTVSNPLPLSLVADNNCYKFIREQDASCLSKRSSDLSSGYPMMTYAPIYYFVVGAGAHLGAMFGNQYADIGGRLFSFFFNMSLIGLTLLMVWRRGLFGLSLFPIVLTPMALFLIPTINPSGGEVCAALFFTTSMYLFVEEKANNNQKLRFTDYSALFSSTLIFVLSRPSAMVWALFISMIILTNSYVKFHDARQVIKSLKIIVPPFLVGLAFHVTHPHQTGSPDGFTANDKPEFSYYFQGFITSIENLPRKLWESYGVLGWLDTPAPVSFVLAYYFLVLILMFLIIKRIKISKFSIAIMFF
jgi:hypothetical protein